MECYNRYKSGDIQGALHLQTLLSDADSIGPKTGGIREFRLVSPFNPCSSNDPAGLKTAIVKYYGYGSQAVRAPLQVVEEDRLKLAEGLLAELKALEDGL